MNAAPTILTCANACLDLDGNRKAAGTYLPDGVTPVCGACALGAWLTPAERRAILPAFTPTEEAVLRALRPEGRAVLRSAVITSVWGVRPQRQDCHDRHALAVNLSRMGPKLRARGQSIEGITRGDGHALRLVAGCGR